MNSEARQILEAVKAGSMSIDDALLEIKKEPFEDIGYAKVDLHRKIRQGAAEVIYGAGKTPEQMIGIVSAMLKNGQDHILITRLSSEAADMISQVHPLHYHKDARVGIIGEMPKPTGKGKIVVATGGTSDIPVAEEAALTAEIHANEVVRLYDVGVAGLHRLLNHMDEIMSASNHCNSRNGRRTSKCNRRLSRLPCHCSSYKRRIRCILWRCFSTFVNA